MSDKHWPGGGVLERDRQRDASAKVRDKSRPEASKTAAVRPFSHARIDNARRCLRQEDLGQSLRAGIGIRSQAVPEFHLITNVMKRGPKVGEILNVVEDFFMRPVDFLKFSASMKGYFGTSGLEPKAGIPRPAFWTVKSATLGPSIGECCIHDVSVKDAKHELVDADARQQARLAEQTIVGCTLEFRELPQLTVFVDESRQGTLSFERVLAG